MFDISIDYNACGLKSTYSLLYIHITDFSRYNYSTTSNEKVSQTVFFNRSLNISGNQNLTDADKSNSLFSEVLNVNFELGNEVRDDFDEENLEVTSFSTDTEKTKISGKIILSMESFH